MAAIAGLAATRVMWVAIASVFGLTALFVPARIAYVKSQKVDEKPGAVTIMNYAFSPETLRVATGSKVKFTNADGTPHTATADDGSFDSGRISAGQGTDVTITKAGGYHCSIHPQMKATIETAG